MTSYFKTIAYQRGDHLRENPGCKPPKPPPFPESAALLVPFIEDLVRINRDLLVYTSLDGPETVGSLFNDLDSLRATPEMRRFFRPAP